MSDCADCGLPWTPAEPLIDGLCEVCWHAEQDYLDGPTVHTGSP
jgi:NMD protein affecting ribosome stability and mRNA decay